MRQFIRYKMEVFFLKRNLDLARLLLGQRDAGSCLVWEWEPPGSGGAEVSSSQEMVTCTLGPPMPYCNIRQQ